MAPPERFELPTPWSEATCSDPLSYGGKDGDPAGIRTRVSALRTPRLSLWPTRSWCGAPGGIRTPSDRHRRPVPLHSASGAKTPLLGHQKWRSGRDSNPRAGFPTVGLANRVHRPLEHHSKTYPAAWHGDFCSPALRPNFREDPVVKPRVPGKAVSPRSIKRDT